MMESQPTEGAAAKTTGGAAALTNQWRNFLHERLAPEELKEYRLQESIRVRRHQHRQERTMSQEELLEHRAKMAASKREQRRKRQRDDETPDEEAARKSYERDRKREQRRRKNESQADCIPLQNKRPQSEEEPLTQGNNDTSSLLLHEPQTSFVVSTQWIMCRPDLQDRGTCHFHADYRLPSSPETDS
jgi:hypothetical protein